MHHTFLCLQVIALLAYNLYEPVLKNEDNHSKIIGKISWYYILLHFDDFLKDFFEIKTKAQKI